MKKVLFLAALSSLALLSCSKKELELNSGLTKSTITIVAEMYDSHEIIPDVTIEVLGQKKIQTTDQTGKAKFELPAGVYKMKISGGEEYAAYFKTISIDVENDGVPIVGNQIVIVKMYPMVGAVQGSTTILRNEKVTYQSDVKLKAISACLDDVDFVDIYFTDSGSDGKFQFENLPAGANLTIKGEYIDNDVLYEAEYGDCFGGDVLCLKEDVTFVLPAIRLEKFGNVFAADIVELPKAKSDPLKLTFAMPINKTEIRTGDIYVLNVDANLIGITYSFSNSDRTISIYTADSEGWRPGGLDDYYFVVNLKSATGDALYEEGNFGVEGFTGPISNLNATYEEQGWLLTWTQSDNAEGYEIYVKTAGVSDYVYERTIAHDNSSVTKTQSIELFDYFSWIGYAYGDYSIKVVGYNATMRGEVKDATPIAFKFTDVLPAVKSISYSSSRDRITFSKVPNADEYEIYIKKDGDANFSLLTSILDDGEEETNQIIEDVETWLLGLGVVAGDDYYIRIIGINWANGLAGDLEEAPDTSKIEL